MLYFKTIPFPDNVKQPEIEKALRKYALKKSSLDFKSSAMDIGTEKIFFGLENKTSLKFTRIKTSFEFLLPKLIISLPKDEMATAYKVRLSAIPFAVCILLSFSGFTIILSLINGRTDIDAMIFILVLTILFYSLLLLELKLSKSGVLKSIRKDKDQ